MGDRNRSRILDSAEVRSPFPESAPRKVGPEELAAKRQRELEAKFEAGRKEGFDKGFADGVAQATAKFEEQAAAMRSEMCAAVKQLVSLEEERLHEAARLLGDLALQAATQMLRQKIEDGDPVATRAIEEAIGVLPPGVSMRARVHPDDVDGANKDLDGEVSSGKLTLVGDASVTRGGCVIESDAGTVDATVETAVAAAADALTGSAEPAAEPAPPADPA